MARNTARNANKPQSEQARAYTPYTALTLDKDCLIHTYGDAASNLFGFPENFMLGKPIGKILPALSLKLEEQLNQTSSPIKLSEVRMQAKHADGKTFPVVVGLRQDYQQGCCRHLVLIRNLQARPKAV